MRNVAAYAATLFFINPVEPVCLVLPVRVIGFFYQLKVCGNWHNFCEDKLLKICQKA